MAKSLWGGALLSLLLAPVLWAGIPVPIHSGPDIDTEPTLLLQEDGSLVVVFSRMVERQGNKKDYDLYFSTAVDLDAALAGGWAAPVPVEPAALAAVQDEAGSLAPVAGDQLGLFFTSDRTQTEAIWLTTSSGAGTLWSRPTAPLSLQEDPGVATRNPSAIRHNGLSWLAYEVEGPLGPEVHLSVSLNLFVWTRPIPIAGNARNPALAELASGELMIAYEDADLGGLWVVTSPTGEAGSWSNPEQVPIPAGRGAAVLPHWDGRPSVYGGGEDPVAAWSIQRTFRHVGGDWSVAEPLELQMGQTASLDPAPVVLEPGVLCLAFDARSEPIDAPVEADILFTCLIDFSCTEAPTFGGLKSVADPDVCLWTGVHLEWDPPTDYGSASVEGARYYVYRSRDPFFEPRTPFAGPFDGTSYTDGSIQQGIPHYYIVRAENLEECPAGNGPMNGMMDTNVLRKVGIDEIPLPPQQGPVQRVRVRRIRPTGGLRLNWKVVPDAAEYRVYRQDGDEYSANGFVPLPETWQVPEAEVWQGDQRLTFLQVRPLSACGLEGE